MEIRPLALACLLAMPLVAACSVVQPHTSRAQVAATHLIFNPEWTRLPSLPCSRAEWPVTNAYDKLREDIAYSETIWDWQARFGGRGEQSSYRRFHSVRTGEIRR